MLNRASENGLSATDKADLSFMECYDVSDLCIIRDCTVIYKWPFHICSLLNNGARESHIFPLHLCGINSGPKLQYVSILDISEEQFKKQSSTNNHHSDRGLKRSQGSYIIGKLVADIKQCQATVNGE